MAEKVSSITKAPAVSDVHILWITAGLSCDGDSVSVTAAEQPSIEDVLLGAIPGCPRFICTTRCSLTKTAMNS
jgi:hydrogenase small subunit